MYAAVAARARPLNANAALQQERVHRQLKERVEAAAAAGVDGVDVNADPAVVTPALAGFCRSRRQELLVWVSPTARESCALFAYMARLGE